MRRDNRNSLANLVFGDPLTEAERLRSKRERAKELARSKPKKEPDDKPRLNLCKVKGHFGKKDMSIEKLQTSNLVYRPIFEGVLYHFCASRFLPSIRKNGLRIGRVPWGTLDQIQLIPGYQWLTTNPEFTQSWAEGSTLPYDRTEVRIQIILPKSVRFSLLKWTDIGQENPLYETLSAFGDPENWYLFKGTVIPYWFTEIVWKKDQ